MKHTNTFEKGQMLISPEREPSQSFTNGHNGQLNYNGQELSFSNKNGTLEISASAEFNLKVKEIVGDFAFEDELILLTKSNLNEVIGYTWSVKEVSPNNYSFTLIHEADYNFADNTYLVTAGVNENSNYKRVYFSDGVQPFRSINVKYPLLTNLSIDELNMFPEVKMNQPTVSEINEGGSLPAMSVQYCYRLSNFNGNFTKFSVFSDRTVVLDNYTDIEKETAGVPGDNTNKSVKILISDIDFSKFKTIECFALQYEIKDVLTSVKSLGIINLISSSVFFTHNGNEPEASVSIDEVLKNSDSFKTVKVINTYESLFLAGNIGYAPTQIYDFDARIKSSDRYDDVFTEDYNPDSYEFEFVPGTVSAGEGVYGGTSDGFSTGNGIRVSFTTQTEDLSNADYTSIELPNPDVSSSSNTEPSLVDSFDSFGNKLFNESIRYSPNKASYQRNEIYRLAFKATKDNKDSFVKYIGDVKVPAIYNKINYINDQGVAVLTQDKYNVSETVNDIVVGMAIYLKVELKLPQNIIDNFDSFEILRVKRDSENKTIIDQGVLFPTGDIDESFVLQNDQHYPAGYQYKQGVTLPEKISFINYVGLYMNLAEYKLGNVYSFDSPTVVNQVKDYKDTSYSKMRILSNLKILKYENKILNAPEDPFNAYTGNGNHYYINTGDYHRHVLYGHNEISTIALDINNSYFAGENQIIPSGIIPEKDVFKLGNFGLPTWSGERQQEGVSSISSTIDTIYDDNPVNNRFKLSSAKPTLFLKLSVDYLTQFTVNTFAANDFSEFPFLETDGILEAIGTSASVANGTTENNNGESRINIGDEIISNLLLVSLERELVNQYGGRDEFSISQNQYVSIHKQEINGTDYSFTVGNGDIYIDMFHHQKFSTKNSPDLPSNFFGRGAYQPEHYVSVTSSISVALETQLPQIFAKGEKLIKSGINTKGETYIFNDAYISQEAKISIPQPFNFEEVTEFSNLIQVSEIKLKGDPNDSWSNFRLSNFHELDLDKGDLTNLIKINDLMFSTQSNESLSQIFINPRAVIPTDDGRGITIGSSSPINIEYSKTISKYGTSFYNSIAIKDDSFMFFNDKYRKIILFKGGVVSVSDATFNQNSLYERLKDKAINNSTGVYDEVFSEMIISLNYGNNETVSISYNCDNKFQLFNGTSDFVSSHFINFKDKVFAKNNLKKLHIKNEGPKGSYFNIVKDFELEFVVNPSLEDVKIFDNFIGIIKSNGVKFKTLSFKTNIVDEQVLLGTDTRYKIREGRHLIPYREKVGKPRMRGDYMIVKITFENLEDKNISITSVITAVRKSFK